MNRLSLDCSSASCAEDRFICRSVVVEDKDTERERERESEGENGDIQTDNSSNLAISFGLEVSQVCISKLCASDELRLANQG